jgi:hypothetical protein
MLAQPRVPLRVDDHGAEPLPDRPLDDQRLGDRLSRPGRSDDQRVGTALAPERNRDRTPMRVAADHDRAGHGVRARIEAPGDQRPERAAHGRPHREGKREQPDRDCGPPFDARVAHGQQHCEPASGHTAVGEHGGSFLFYAAALPRGMDAVATGHR